MAAQKSGYFTLQEANRLKVIQDVISEFIYQLYDSIWLIIFLIEIQKISKILIYIGYILQS